MIQVKFFLTFLANLFYATSLLESRIFFLFHHLIRLLLVHQYLSAKLSQHQSALTAAVAAAAANVADCSKTMQIYAARL